jgi:hypothetical protein
MKKINEKYEAISLWSGLRIDKYVENGPDECPFCQICPNDHTTCKPDIFIYPDLKKESHFSDVLKVYEKIKMYHINFPLKPNININDLESKIDIIMSTRVLKQFHYDSYIKDFQSVLVDAIMYYFNKYIQKG